MLDNSYGSIILIFFSCFFVNDKKGKLNECGFVCPKDETCFLHEKLNRLTDFVEWIRDRDLNKNIVVTKITIFFEKDSIRRDAFWWYNYTIWDFKDVPDNVTM